MSGSPRETGAGASGSGRAAGLTASAWMLVAVVTLAVIGLFLRDHIPVGGGLGYDGETYGYVALWPERLFDLPFNRVQRCLPSLVAHLVIRGLGLPFTPGSVVAVFSATNALLLVAGLGIWLRIAAHLRLRVPSTVFGFCGLFVSFSGATMPYYYPVLTDTWALFLGLVAAHAYLLGSRPVLLAVVFVSGLVWPSLPYFLAPLVVFPRGRGPVPALRAAAWRDRLGFAAAVTVVCATAWAVVRGGWSDPIDALLPLSIATLAAYVFLGTRALLACGDSGPGLPPAGRAAMAAGLVAFLAVFLLLQASFAIAFTRSTEFWQRPSNLSALILVSAVRAPGSFLLGHAINFGILFLFAVAFWRRVCGVAGAMGLGAWLFLAGSFAFSLNAESRHATALWPLVATFTCVALDRVEWPRPWLAVFCGLSLVNSRALILLNDDFPRLYFANFALTMDTTAYAAQTLAFLAVAAYLHLLWRATRGGAPAAHPPADAAEDGRG